MTVTQSSVNFKIELLQEFHDLTFDDQMSKLEFYCTESGLYTSDLEASDFGKVSEACLTEVQEAQSASVVVSYGIVYAV